MFLYRSRKIWDDMPDELWERVVELETPCDWMGVSKKFKAWVTRALNKLAVPEVNHSEFCVFYKKLRQFYKASSHKKLQEELFGYDTPSDAIVRMFLIQHRHRSKRYEWTLAQPQRGLELYYLCVLNAAYTGVSQATYYEQEGDLIVIRTAAFHVLRVCAHVSYSSYYDPNEADHRAYELCLEANIMNVPDNLFDERVRGTRFLTFFMQVVPPFVVLKCLQEMKQRPIQSRMHQYLGDAEMWYALLRRGSSPFLATICDTYMMAPATADKDVRRMLDDIVHNNLVNEAMDIHNRFV